MKRPLLIGAGVALLIVLLGAGGVYAYYFSGLRTAPKPLGLTSPAPTSTAAPVTSAGLPGTWRVTNGSQAGYRVQEVFAGTTSPHVADSRTASISGGFTVGAASGGSYPVSDISLTAGLGGLHSVDQVLGRDVTQRDFVVQRALSVSRFPNATFSAGSAAVPDTVSAGPVDLSIPGMLTVHGVTKPVTATAKAQVSGGRIEIAGSVVTNMADFGIDPPAAPFVTVDQGVTIEFDIFLTRS